MGSSTSSLNISDLINRKESTESSLQHQTHRPDTNTNSNYSYAHYYSMMPKKLFIRKMVLVDLISYSDLRSFWN